MASSHSRFSDFAETVQGLEGANRGQSFPKLNQVKSYLQYYGYYPNTASVDLTDDFDESLETALKGFQESFGLQTTGGMGSATVKQMCTPRCGNQNLDSETHQPVSLYSLLPTKWSKSKLTYRFNGDIPDERRQAIRNGFSRWANNSEYKFAEAQQGMQADINIRFDTRDREDGHPLDDHYSLLAHAFGPEDGRVHFDAAEIWSTSENPAAGSLDLESVWLHEIGHLLGLGHSSNTNAVMYESFQYGVKKRALTKDDTDGIRARYQT